MRKLNFIALVLAALLLFSACAGNQTYPYEDGEHTHVFGNPYDVVPETCVSEGTQVRYCKICEEQLISPLPVPEDKAKRKHAFSDTVIAATESTEGYTVRRCQHCEYVVERADVVPARYALLTVPEVTVTTAPGGILGALMSDTDTHVLRYGVGGETSVPATLACRLAVALTLTEAFEAEGATLSPETTVTPETGSLSGHTYSLSALLSEWLKNGGADVAKALSLAFGEGEDAFALRVEERLLRLGVRDATDLAIYTESGTATLYATGVMVARALDTPLLCTLFESNVGALTQVAGTRPCLYYVESGFRVTALAAGAGIRFLLLYGNALAEDVENGFYAE